jgi:predicted outer membrane repeat protein
MGHMTITNTSFDTCIAENGGAIYSHGVMVLTDTPKFTNNTARSNVSKTVGNNSGSDCLCVWAGAPGVGTTQCHGCTPDDQPDCHKVAGEPQPGQPAFYCP